LHLSDEYIGREFEKAQSAFQVLAGFKLGEKPGGKNDFR